MLSGEAKQGSNKRERMMRKNKSGCGGGDCDFGVLEFMVCVFVRRVCLCFESFDLRRERDL